MGAPVRGHANDGVGVDIGEPERAFVPAGALGEGEAVEEDGGGEIHGGRIDVRRGKWEVRFQVRAIDGEVRLGGQFGA